MPADPLDKQLVEAVLSRPRRAKADIEEAKLAGLRPRRAAVAVADPEDDDDDDDDDDDLDLGPVGEGEPEGEVVIIIVVVIVAGHGDAGLGAGRAQAGHLGLFEVRLGAARPRQDGLHELLV